MNFHTGPTLRLRDTICLVIFMRIVFAIYFSPACSYKDELHVKHEGTPGIIH